MSLTSVLMAMFFIAEPVATAILNYNDQIKNKELNQLMTTISNKLNTSGQNLSDLISDTNYLATLRSRMPQTGKVYAMIRNKNSKKMKDMHDLSKSIKEDYKKLGQYNEQQQKLEPNKTVAEHLVTGFQNVNNWIKNNIGPEAIRNTIVENKTGIKLRKGGNN